MIRLILNLLWFFLGGFASGLAWLFGGLLLAFTVVGLPWAFSAWRIASYSFWPFGREIVWRDPNPADLGAGCLGVGLNVIWLVLAMCGGLTLTIVFPQLALWLPGRLGYL